jgi:anti-sigma regulatory factor (Ser/Thr protein kinase)
MQRVVVLTRDRFAPSVARAALSEFDGALPGRQGDAKLVVSELVTDRVQHRHAASKEPIELSIELSSGSLHLEVRDPVKEDNCGGAAPAEEPAALVGLGLAIVSALADAWGVRRERTCVWARFDIQRPT